MDERRLGRRLLLGTAIGGLTAALPRLAGCGRPRSRPVVGFAQVATVGAWRIAETRSVREAAEAHRYDLVVADAQDSTAKQIGDVEDLVAHRVDALFIAPREYAGLEPAFEAAGRARIPVLLIDHDAAGRPGIDYLSFLGSDFAAQGWRAADWLAGAMNGRASIMELAGTPGSSVARDRARGFRDRIRASPEMQIVRSQSADFVRTTAHDVMGNLLAGTGREITAVYAHNDEMALGAIQALATAGRHPGKDVTVVSIDGERRALEAIIAHQLGATVESNPRFGPLAFEVLEQFRERQPVPARLILEDRLFDVGNAAACISDAY